MGYHLGVDVGTTYTAAAVHQGAEVRIVGLGNRAMQIPSVVYLGADGQFLVGEAAEMRAMAEPERVAREFKRRLGDPVPILLGGTPVSPQALTAQLLAWVLSAVTQREGSAPDSITVSHPANWGPYKRDLLGEAFRLADLNDVHTCIEPEAAAVNYATRQRVEVGECVAIYDLGGGTFDAALLRREYDRFRLLGTPEGIEHLGGVDFDAAIFEHVMRSLGDAGRQFDLDDPAIVRGLERLRRACVEAKESLSVDTEAPIPITIGSIDRVVRLTRAEFEDMVRPAIRQTVEALRRVLRAANVTSDEIRAIVLVGGSSRIPLVSEVLSGAFGRPLALDTHPKHDIALGAALLDPGQHMAPATPERETQTTAHGSVPHTTPADARGTPQPTGLSEAAGISGAGRSETEHAAGRGRESGHDIETAGRQNREGEYRRQPPGSTVRGDRSSPWRKNKVLLGASVAVIVAAGLAVALGTGLIGDSSSHRNSPLPQSSSQVASTSRSPQLTVRTINVPATRKWTDTHLECAVGDVLDITATGTIQVSLGGSPVDADGFPNVQLRQYNIPALRGVNHGALIGSVDRVQPFLVGKEKSSFPCPRSGELFLGVNDAGLDNNSGRYVARIALRSPG